MKARLVALLLGGAEFGEDEAYFRFQFRALFVLMGFGVLSSTTFITGHLLGRNPMGPHVWIMGLHVALCLAFGAWLHGRKDRFLPVAVAYALVCLGVLLGALVFVPWDELRVLWFPVSMPAVYLLLGPRVGSAATAGLVLLLLGINPWLSRPYSGTALMTLVAGFLALAVLFHAYASRSLSYYTELLASRERLRWLAQHDPLTGLLNARTYYELADRLLALAQRSGAPCAVVFVDLDHFKAINDTHGHEAGDVVLREASACLHRGVRASDVLGRIGGEEFAIFLPDTDLEGARHLAEKLRQALEGLNLQLEGRRVPVTASLGVATRAPHHVSIQGLQREADQAMYQAKQAGRNRVTCLALAGS